MLHATAVMIGESFPTKPGLALQALDRPPLRDTIGAHARATVIAFRAADFGVVEQVDRDVPPKDSLPTWAEIHHLFPHAVEAEWKFITDLRRDLALGRVSAAGRFLNDVDQAAAWIALSVVRGRASKSFVREDTRPDPSPGPDHPVDYLADSLTADAQETLVEALRTYARPDGRSPLLPWQIVSIHEVMNALELVPDTLRDDVESALINSLRRESMVHVTRFRAWTPYSSLAERVATRLAR